ncbi:MULTISPECIES: DUF1064 domain-containing protein [Bacteria]|uniref:DUF1064 domain-containing protein n=1 Tax=Kitasatospora cinereorecta TaxID=285560 RepID=A0ABW0VTL0_9ACTN
MRPRNKFGAKRTEIDGIKFDSIGESKRYLVLKARLERGLISDLRLQKSYALTNPNTGMKYGRYIADFVYFENGQEVVEDFKSKITASQPIFKYKKKMMLDYYNIEIKEVFKPDE